MLQALQRWNDLVGRTCGWLFNCQSPSRYRMSAFERDLEVALEFGDLNLVTGQLCLGFS